MDYEPDDIDYDEDAKVTGTIVDSDLSHDRLENLAKLVVDTWDMQAVIEFAYEQVFQNYQYDIDSAVRDANDLELTTEELDDA
jgi:hypothetical protein